MIVVYLSNRYIRIVDGEYSHGTAKVRRILHAIDTQGCIMNGSLAEPDKLKEILWEAWESNGLPKKDVSLLLDSSQFTTKVMDIPIAKPSQMMDFVSREFSDVERIENPVCSYFPMITSLPKNNEGGAAGSAGVKDKKNAGAGSIAGADAYGAGVGAGVGAGKGKQGKKEKKPKKAKKAKIQTVFATVAPRAFLNEYVMLFAELGIKLSRIDVARGASLRMLEGLESLKGRSCIVQSLNDRILQNFLFYEGRHLYSGRNRLFSDPGTPEYAVEIARSLSNILQFAKTQNLPEKITEIYTSGIHSDVMDVYVDSVGRIDDELEVSRLSLGNAVSLSGDVKDTLFEESVTAVAGLWPLDEKSGFVAQLLRDPEKEAQKKKTMKQIIPVAILGGVLLSISAVLLVQHIMLRLELHSVKEYNRKAQEAVQRYDKAYSEVVTLQELLTNAMTLDKMVKAYPMVDSTVVQTVDYCAKGLVVAVISDYQSSTGILSFYTSAADVNKINWFIALLEEQDIFEDVDYTGYRQRTNGDWEVVVNCRMAERQEVVNDDKTD